MNSKSQQKVILQIQRGITLLELVVVLTIVFIVISLLAFALSRARESARMITCSSQMRELGLALQNYEASFRAMPPSGHGWSVQSRLLPYLGETNRYNHIRFGVAYEESLNEPFMKVPRAFLCPSDPVTTSTANAFSTNYLGVAGGGVAANAETTGLLISYHGAESTVRLASVTDGTSNTVAFTEGMSYFRYANGTEAPFRKGAVFKTSQKYNLPSELTSFEDECFGSVPDTSKAQEGLGSVWADPSIGISRICFINPKQIRNCLNGGGYVSALLAPSSLHQNRVYCGFADARVQSVDQNVSPEVWQAYGTRNQGEMLIDRLNAL